MLMILKALSQGDSRMRKIQAIETKIHRLSARDIGKRIGLNEGITQNDKENKGREDANFCLARMLLKNNELYRYAKMFMKRKAVSRIYPQGLALRQMDVDLTPHGVVQSVIYPAKSGWQPKVNNEKGATRWKPAIC
jgi:hypothetical protein